MTRTRWFGGLVLFGLPFGFIACGDDDSDRYRGDGRTDLFDGTGDADSFCRENPGDCDGDIGGSCDRNDDCASGTCCTEDKVLRAWRDGLRVPVATTSTPPQRP